MNALLRPVAGECGSIRNVTKVRVRADVADPRGEIRCSIHSQRQHVTLAHGDVDQLQLALFPEVRQLARRIERGPYDREGMGEQLHATLARSRGPRGLRLLRSFLRSRQKSSADVVSDIAVQCLVGPIEPELPGSRCEHEIHLHALLHTGTPVLEINRACVFQYFLPLLRSGWIAGDVPAAVEIRQLAVTDDLQRFHCHDAVAAAERVSGTRHELQFGSRALTGKSNRERRNDRKCH